jgi:hypothetical protein
MEGFNVCVLLRRRNMGELLHARFPFSNSLTILATR